VVELRGGVFGRGASVGAVDLTYDEFHRLVGQGGRLVVNFWADRCPLSRQFHPIFERAAPRHPDVVFGKVDVDAVKGLTGPLEISQLPTLTAIYGGSLLYKEPGVHRPDQVDEVVAALRRVR
jgi:thioredoxin 1